MKVIGIITMVIDHVGKVFFPYDLYWQMVGRLCFPIFAFCLVVGFLYTANRRKYFTRLAVLALVSQPFYVFAFEYDYWEPNIFVTLLLGLASLWFLHKKWWLAYAAVCIVVIVAPIDYGIEGMLMINCMYLFRNTRLRAILSLSSLFIMQLFIALDGILSELILTQKFHLSPSPSLNFLGLFALPLLYANVGFKFKMSRGFFYAFYPLHLFAIMLAKHIYGIFLM